MLRFTFGAHHSECDTWVSSCGDYCFMKARWDKSRGDVL
jgi:hypothetical protein